MMTSTEIHISSPLHIGFPTVLVEGALALLCPAPYHLQDRVLMQGMLHFSDRRAFIREKIGENPQRSAAEAAGSLEES